MPSQWQATIKSNTKVPCRCWGWDYITTKDYWGRLNLTSLLRVANYEEFSFWWVDWKTIRSEPGINIVKGGGEQEETVMRLVGWKWNVNLRVISISMILNWSLCKDLTDRACIQRKEKRTKDRTLWYTCENAGRWSGMWLNRNWLCSIQEVGSN